jgi:hypothetical protein
MLINDKIFEATIQPRAGVGGGLDRLLRGRAGWRWPVSIGVGFEVGFPRYLGPKQNYRHINEEILPEFNVFHNLSSLNSPSDICH